MCRCNFLLRIITHSFRGDSKNRYWKGVTAIGSSSLSKLFLVVKLGLYFHVLVGLFSVVFQKFGLACVCL